LLAAHGDAGAAAAIGNARRIGLTVNRVNRGLLGYADAILAGRAGDQRQATELAVTADSELRHYPIWADLARLCAAEPALADGWGQPRHRPGRLVARPVVLPERAAERADAAEAVGDRIARPQIPAGAMQR